MLTGRLGTGRAGLRGCGGSRAHRSPASYFAHPGSAPSLESIMSTLRKNVAIALMIAMGGAMAHAETKPAAKDIVIVHGALVDGSGWRAVCDILTKDGFHVTIVQEPLTSLGEDVDATRRVIDQQTGRGVLGGHSDGGGVVRQTGQWSQVGGPGYVSRPPPPPRGARGCGA